jgi:hypothetical protein
MLEGQKGRIIRGEKDEIREGREARGLRWESNNWGRMCGRGKGNRNGSAVSSIFIIICCVSSLRLFSIGTRY